MSGSSETAAEFVWRGSGNMPNPTLVRTDFSGPLLKLQLFTSGRLTLKAPLLLSMGASPLDALPSQIQVITPSQRSLVAGLAITNLEGLNWYFWQSDWQNIFELLKQRGFPTQERIREPREIWRFWSKNT